MCQYWFINFKRCKMLLVGKTVQKRELYWNSLYYLIIFSVKSKTVLKNKVY